ncbi:MAG: phage tail assembly protein [Rhodoferax sp.]
MSKKTSDWLTIGPEKITVKLSRPTTMNGVKQDKIALRVPTVGDLRAAAKHCKDDKEEQEIFLFASLAECAPGDIEKLSVKDYNRVQEGYFRLITDDNPDGTETAGKAAGD